MWEALTKPDILSNVLDALSFILITPEVAGPQRIGRLLDLINRPVQWFVDTAETTVPKFYTIWLSVSLSILAAFILYAGIFVAAFLTESSYLETVVRGYVLLRQAFGIFLAITSVIAILSTINLISQWRLSRLVALWAGIGCFFTARVVAISGA